MNGNYESPKMDVSRLETKDVITASVLTGADNEGNVSGL